MYETVSPACLCDDDCPQRNRHWSGDVLWILSHDASGNESPDGVDAILQPSPTPGQPAEAEAGSALYPQWASLGPEAVEDQAAAAAVAAVEPQRPSVVPDEGDQWSHQFQRSRKVDDPLETKAERYDFLETLYV